MSDNNKTSNLNSVFCKGCGDESILGLLNDIWRMSCCKGSHDSLYSLISEEGGHFWEGNPEMFLGIWNQNYIGMYSWTPILSDDLIRFHIGCYCRLFDLQSDGTTIDFCGDVVPKGAIPEYINFEDGIPRYKVDEYLEGTVHYEDFWVEGTAAISYCFSELILCTRDSQLLDKYLPRIELACDWLYSLRDERGLIAVGPGGTLIEREYGATYLGDLKYEKGYPSGAMVWYIAANRQLAELEKLAGNHEKAEIYFKRADEGRDALNLLFVSDSYLVNYIDSKGKLHGVVGASEHGYFESNPNHDAIATGAVDKMTAEKIYASMKSVDGLFNDYGQVRCVYPTHDDCMPNYDHHINPLPVPCADPNIDYSVMMHEHEPGVHWNGSIWFSSFSRMINAMYILDKYEDLIAPLNRHVEFYNNGYICDQIKGDGSPMYTPEFTKVAMIDFFETFGAALRGLFEYRYTADSLVIYPHIYPGIEQFEQVQPVRYGDKKIYLKVNNSNTGGIIKAVLNGKVVELCSDDRIELKYDILTLGDNFLEINI